MHKRLRVGISIGILAVSLAGCARIQDSQGYVADQQVINAIQPGVDNRESVMQALGRPTFEGGFDEKQWYYVSRQTEQLAFLRPKPTDQDIVVVSFDANGTVTEVEKRGLEQAASIDPVDDKTPTLGRETGILQDLFGNIGSVGAAGPAGGAPY